MNGVLGHLCAHIGLTGPGEPREDGDMSEMTVPSRYRIRNSVTEEAPHIESLRVSGEETFHMYLPVIQYIDMEPFSLHCTVK